MIHSGNTYIEDYQFDMNGKQNMIENILPRSFRSSLMVIFLTGVLPTSFLFADSNEAYPELRKILRNLDSEVERYKTLYHKQVEDAKTLESQGYTAKAKRRLKKLGSLDDHIQSKLPIIEKKFIRPYIGKVYSFEATKGEIDDKIIVDRIRWLPRRSFFVGMINSYNRDIKSLNEKIRKIKERGTRGRQMAKAFGIDLREESRKLRKRRERYRKERSVVQSCLKTYLSQKPYRRPNNSAKINSIIEQLQEYAPTTSEEEHRKNIVYRVKYKLVFYVDVRGDGLKCTKTALDHDTDGDGYPKNIRVSILETMKPVGAILAGRRLNLKQLSNKRFMQKIKKEIDEEKRIKELEERKAREQKEEAERIEAKRIEAERIEAERQREKEAKDIIEAGYQRVSFYFDLGLGATFGNFTGSDFSVSSPDKNSFFFHGHLSMGMKFWYLIIYSDLFFQITSFDRVLEGSHFSTVFQEQKLFEIKYKITNHSWSLGGGLKFLLGKSGVYLRTSFHPITFFESDIDESYSVRCPFPISYREGNRICDNLKKSLEENLNALRGISFLGGIGFTLWGEKAFLSASIEGFVYLTKFQNWDIFYGVKASFGYF